MAIIEPVPDIIPLWQDSVRLARIFKASQAPGIQQFIRRANDKYYYWEDLRYRMPQDAGISAEELWAYLKIMRGVNTRNAPFTDKRRRPFTYWIPNSLYRALSEVDQWSGGLITSDQPVSMPSRERYIINSLMDEAIASSQLEGASTEYRVAKEMLRTGRKPTDKNERMILNNWHAMQYIRDNQKKAFSIDKLCEIQAILTQGTLEHPEEAGKFRTRDDIVVKYLERVVHEPPAFRDLEERMRALCDFANRDDEEDWTHPVVKGAMIHFWLAYDHPFTDGNGRTARALMYWYLLKRSYALFEYISISKHFVRAPGQYVRAYLYTETDDNDLTYFLIYNLRATRYALQDVRKYIESKHREVVAANNLLRSFKGLNARQKSLVYHAIQHGDGLYTIEAHKNTHGVGYETARRDMMRLVERGFLKKEREGKRLFVFVPSERMLERLRANQISHRPER